MHNTRVTFGMIVLNGEPFIRYNLQALYPFAYQIVVVEGACLSARGNATADGHSRDRTLTVIRDFKASNDPGNKIITVTAEDGGHPDGFWAEKDEMSQAYAKIATGDYLWQIDVDEFYLPKDMERILNLLGKQKDITAITFPMRTFWGGLEYIVDGFYLRQFKVHRVFRWKPGYRYITHRPPTVIDEHGTDLRKIRHVDATEMARKGIYIYHYELLFPRQVSEKCGYYSGAEWTYGAFSKLQNWYRNGYETLKWRFHPHMVYHHMSWLERFEGDQPPMMIAMINSVNRDEYDGIGLRDNRDIEDLLHSSFYKFLRALLMLLVPLHSLLTPLAAPVRRVYRKLLNCNK